MSVSWMASHQVEVLLLYVADGLSDLAGRVALPVVTDLAVRLVTAAPAAQALD
jgi:hypothetical protein